MKNSVQFIQSNLFSSIYSDQFIQFNFFTFWCDHKVEQCHFDRYLWQVVGIPVLARNVESEVTRVLNDVLPQFDALHAT